jgi:hypothetical protein
VCRQIQVRLDQFKLEQVEGAVAVDPVDPA